MNNFLFFLVCITILTQGFVNHQQRSDIDELEKRVEVIER